jgi:hypothetical protein
MSRLKDPERPVADVAPPKLSPFRRRPDWWTIPDERAKVIAVIRANGVDESWQAWGDTPPHAVKGLIAEAHQGDGRSVKGRLEGSRRRAADRSS